MNEINNKISFEELREKLIKKGVIDPNGCLRKSCLTGKTLRIESLDESTASRINQRVCSSTKSDIVKRQSALTSGIADKVFSGPIKVLKHK